MEKQTIKLNEVAIQQVDGSEARVDLSKEIAELMYRSAQTLEQSVAAQDLYKTGECEASEAIKALIRQTLEQSGCAYYLRSAVERVL